MHYNIVRIWNYPRQVRVLNLHLQVSLLIYHIEFLYKSL